MANGFSVTTVILAGGQGTRIGGDKGLRILHGRPLLAWVLDAVRSQSDEVLISANEGHEKYAGFGCTIIADQTPDWAGPLAGLQSALRCAHHEWLVSVPCDTPFLPRNLIARLWDAIGNAEAAVAVVQGRRQPAIALYRKSVLPKLDVYLNSGQRKVGGWLDTLQISAVEFDDAEAFVNINSLEDLAAANQNQCWER